MAVTAIMASGKNAGALTGRLIEIKPAFIGGNSPTGFQFAIEGPVRILIMTIGVMLALPAEAHQPITNAEFVARAEPMLTKSMASLMFSSEAKRLMRALDTAAKAARAKQEADRSAGRKSAMCLPPKGKAKIDARQLIAYLKSLPPAEQSRSLDEGFASYAARKYPCPKS